MKKALIVVLSLLPASLVWWSCGGSASTAAPKTSGIAYRAFVTNSVSAGTAQAGVYIVNAATDSKSTVAGISAGNNPEFMVVTPNRTLTVVFSGNNLPSSDNLLSIINNAQEHNAAQLTLPGMTQSIVTSPDSSTAYVAVPTAPVSGQSPGIVDMISLGAGSVSGQVNIPSALYLSISNGGNRVLAFSSVLSSLAAPCNPTPAFLFVITPSNVGIQPCAVTPVPGVNYSFDHPVTAFFSSDDSVAYVLNCGPECGGTQASVQTFETTPNQCLPDGVCQPVPVPAATEALFDSGTLYLAGTPFSGGVPSQPCTGQTTAATTCGLLTIFDLNTMSIANAAPIVITDGYHNRIAMGPNGQLFIGAHTCTEIIPPLPVPTGAETRGCLSIYNTLTTAVGSAAAGGVLVPPVNGDVTGLAPIVQRGVVRGNDMPPEVIYVIQGQGVPLGGTLFIYDTTIDALEDNPNNRNNPGEVFGLVGDLYDVKTIDF